MALILEITQHNGLVVRQPIDPNSAKIAAQPGDKLRVLDAASGQPAGDLVARRVGDSLVVEQAGGATVELTEFFAQCAPGEGCELVLEDGDKTTTISQATEPMSVAADGSQVMYDGSMAAQAGAAPAKEGAAAAADSAAPAGDAAAAATSNTGAIIAGVGAIGLAAAAGGGGGGGGGTTEEPDETAPDAPVINAVAGDDIVNQGEETNGVEVSGTAEAGSTVSVTWGEVTKTATAGEDGAWSVSFAANELPADGPTTISATATDAAGNVSEAGTRPVTVATDTVDSTPPDAPTVDAVGPVNAATAAAGVTISGTAEPGSTVTATWGGATQTATADAATGAWSVSFDQAEVPADGATTISVTATDTAGNASAATDVPVTVDTAAPAAATIDDVEGDNVVSAAEAADGVDITGTAEEGSTVEVTWGGLVKTTVAGAGGAWAVNYTAGEIPADGAGDVSVMVTDAAGNPQTDPAATLSVDVQAVATSDGVGGIGGAGDSVIFGGDGGVVLVGDSAGSVRNYQFDYWSNIASAYDPANAFDGGVDGIGGSSIGYDPGAVFGGWATGDVAHPGPGPGTATGGFAEMRGTGGGFDPSGTGGTLLWETVFTGNNGASSLNQDIDTVAGEDYTLSITFGTATEGTSFAVVWNNVVIATYDNTIGPAINEPLNWTGAAPTVVDHAGGLQTTLSFTVPGTGGPTTLELRAFDTVAGDGEGLLVHRVSLEALDGDGNSTAGNDTLVGGAGDDLIFGQGGNDTLWGGEGADTFVFSMFADNGTDTVMDFEVGTDRILLVDAIDANSTDSLSPADLENSDDNLTFADFMVAGTQEIALGDDGSGNLMLTFSGEGGSALGSVTLQGVDAAAYTTVESLVTGGIISFTGDGFHADLMTPVI